MFLSNFRFGEAGWFLLVFIVSSVSIITTVNNNIQLRLHIQEETQVAKSNIEVENKEEEELSTTSAITAKDRFIT